MTQIWDISQRIWRGLPLWPGEPGIVVAQHATISETCPVNIGAISSPLHAGTHADSPFHYDAVGKDSASSALDPYLGICLLVDVRHASGCVRPQDIDWSQVVGVQRILFRTYECFPHDEWDSQFTAISVEVIVRLRDMGVRLVGTDAPSLDPQNSKTMDAHHAVNAGDMRILEGLVLDDVAPGRYELIALPLKISGADASPVRAVLRDLA